MTIPDDDRLMLTAQIRTALAGLMEFTRYRWDEHGSLQLNGQLLAPADQLYTQIRERLEPLGFTPFLSRSGEEDQLLAMPVVLARTPPKVVLPVVLFCITVLTTLLAGAINHVEGCVQNEIEMLGVIWHTLTTPSMLVLGLPFALTLLGILFTHEMGHYIVGRLRGAPVSLPYFIPLPPPLSFTGTMGAVIVQREPMEDRKTILQVGLAGPLAGLAVAIPLLIYGLSTSHVGPPPAPAPGCPAGYTQEGNSILYAGLKMLVLGEVLPSNGRDVQLNDVAWGAWIGLLVTMINLLPVGQLDGGHAAYALLGRRADYLAYVVIALCFALGIALSPTWFVWGILALLIGPRHPPPLNDITRLTAPQMLFALVGLVTFVLLFMPEPLRSVVP